MEAHSILIIFISTYLPPLIKGWTTPVICDSKTAKNALLKDLFQININTKDASSKTAKNALLKDLFQTNINTKDVSIHDWVLGVDIPIQK